MLLPACPRHAEYGSVGSRIRRPMLGLSSPFATRRVSDVLDSAALTRSEQRRMSRWVSTYFRDRASVPFARHVCSRCLLVFRSVYRRTSHHGCCYRCSIHRCFSIDITNFHGYALVPNNAKLCSCPVLSRFWLSPTRSGRPPPTIPRSLV
ncbi:hypothetical protein EJ06DRAFT_43433 [Trichodelitschia bisporula]|uniref:Uncharacterized protein n=1 Tax=Trichodelitschia bisporula TaxID=703511 RepID=A0A6G1HVX3_9PEZI|nr:hypothetical protein EJ06DRAFT_43433 [Trichodelitschia bisporula]